MKPLDRALLAAQKAHSNQTYDIYPYMFHIHQVVEIAQELGYDEEVQIACALHDAMEDDGLSYNDIKKNFGQSVAEIVFAVTDELGRNRKERKERTYHKIKANRKAILVKICDRLANMRHSAYYNAKMWDTYNKEQKQFLISLYDPNDADVVKGFSKFDEII